VQLFSFLG